MCGSDDGTTASASGSASGSGSGTSCEEPGSEDGTTVEARLVDFDIQLDSNTVDAGTVIFDATNDGPADHEIVVVRDVAPAELPFDDEGVVEEAALPTGR